MKWEKDAKEVVDNIPTPEIMKNMTILYAEKLQAEQILSISPHLDRFESRPPGHGLKIFDTVLV